ncbi:MAG: glutathione S-transferase family protein [Paracoccaceae bacterium]
MDDIYRLHYAPDNASMIVRLVLETLEIPYQAVLVDRSAHGQSEPQYLAINPNGLIPTLETAEGPIFETGAILLWLADRHGALAPAPDDRARGHFLKWLFFVSNTLHAGMRIQFYPEQYAGPDTSICTALSRQMAKVVVRHLTTLDTEAGAKRPWFNATNPSTLDFYVAACLRWLALYPKDPLRPSFDLPHFVHLHALALRLDTLPATTAVATAEGLGPTPFSNPRYPNPPEGSAT